MSIRRSPIRRAALTPLLLLAAACGGEDDPADSASPTAETGGSVDATATGTPETSPGPGTSPTTATSESGGDRFPDVVDAVASYDEQSGTWSFAVTISSPYDTPERYADGWRVIGPDGAVYGTHTLAHDHANEQPFTRRQTGVEIPDDVTEVTIEGRDQANGFGGRTVTIELRNA